MVKKVLRIIDRLNIGGPAIHCVLLTEFLPEDEFKTTLLTGHVCDFEGDMSYFTEKYNVTPIYIKSLGKKISLFSDLCAFWEILNIIRKEHPDIVHTHKAKAGALGRVAAFLLHVPKIYHTFHGHVFHGYFGKLKSTIFILIERLLACITTKIVVISEQQFHEICETYHIAPAHKFKIIPLGFDFSNLNQYTQYKGSLRTKYNIPQNHCIIGIVGRLTSIKNHEFFLQVAKQVLQQEKNVSFVIIGDGELRITLEAKVQELQIQNNVYFTGWIQNSPEIYADLDIVTLTSYNEGTPVTLIEALYCKKPVVATNVGGVVNVVHDKVSGLLCDVTDINSFTANLLYMIQNPKERQKMGECGYTEIKDKYSYSRLVNDISELYNQIS